MTADRDPKEKRSASYKSACRKGRILCSKDKPVAMGIVNNGTLVFQIIPMAIGIGKSQAFRVAVNRYHLA